MPDVIAATLDELTVRARALPASGRRRILGITGAPGAGKTSLCTALALALGSAVVGMDGFHLANVELDRLGRAARKGAPDTFDVDGYAACLERLRDSEDAIIYAPAFDRRLEESIAGAIAVAREIPLVLTEGNYLLLEAANWRRVRAAIDCVWFLDVDPELRRQRLVARHESHGRPSADAAEWVRTVDEPNAELIQRTKSHADLVVTLR